MGRLVSGCGGAIHMGTIIACVAGAISINGVAVVGASKAPVSRLLGEGKAKLPSLPRGRCPAVS
jgi:hypothetical protein